MKINSITNTAYYQSKINKQDIASTNYAQNVSMTGKLPSNDVKVSKFKRFMHKLFNKLGCGEQNEPAFERTSVKRHTPKREYKPRKVRAEETPPIIKIERGLDLSDISVKDVFSSGVQVDKVYGKYLTDAYWRIKYESSMPIEAKGIFTANNGRKMQFKSGYGQNFRKSGDKTITVYYNKNSNPSGILKSYSSKSGDVDVELYRDINHGNYERRITKKVNSQLKSDIYCLRNVPELLVIYEKPGDFNGTRYLYKFNNKSERIYRHSFEDGSMKRNSTVAYQDVLENSDKYPMEVVEIIKRNLNENSNTNLIKKLSESDK